MNRPVAKFTVTNGGARARTVAVEPWADEYTLSPQDNLLLVAVGRAEPSATAPWFGVVEWDDTTQVYCEETEEYFVQRAGRWLQHGAEIEVPDDILEWT